MLKWCYGDSLLKVFLVFVYSDGPILILDWNNSLAVKKCWHSGGQFMWHLSVDLLKSLAESEAIAINVYCLSFTEIISSIHFYQPGWPPQLNLIECSNSMTYYFKKNSNELDPIATQFLEGYLGCVRWAVQAPEIWSLKYQFDYGGVSSLSLPSSGSFLITLFKNFCIKAFQIPSALV